MVLKLFLELCTKDLDCLIGMHDCNISLTTLSPPPSPPPPPSSSSSSSSLGSFSVGKVFDEEGNFYEAGLEKEVNAIAERFEKRIYDEEGKKDK